MAVKLKDGEVIKISANFHWMNYIWAGLWAAIWLNMLIPVLMTSMDTIQSKLTSVVGIVLVGAFPSLYKFLQNRCKKYILTNHRLYVEEGILAKSIRDIPIQKINDVEMSQGIFQRLFGSGTIAVLTGNDRSCQIKNIDNPVEFKSQITELIGGRKAR